MLFLSRHCENRETENNFSLRQPDEAETYTTHTYTHTSTHTRNEKNIFSLYHFVCNPMSCIGLVFFVCASEWPITSLLLENAVGIAVSSAGFSSVNHMEQWQPFEGLCHSSLTCGLAVTLYRYSTSGFACFFFFCCFFSLFRKWVHIKLAADKGRVSLWFWGV